MAGYASGRCTAQPAPFLENGIWRTIFEVERFGQTFSHTDYASQKGFTIRYGDGEFGLIEELRGSRCGSFVWSRPFVEKQTDGHRLTRLQIEAGPASMSVLEGL